MSVHQRGRKWVVRFRYNGTNSQETFATEAEAVWFDTACKDKDRGADWALSELDRKDEQDGAPRLSEAFERFCLWKTKRVADARTVNDYRGQFNNWILPYFKDIRVTDLSQKKVQHWVDWMHDERDLSAKSIADRHALLHGILDYVTGDSSDFAVTLESPCAATSLPKRKKKPVRGLTPHEWIALRDGLIHVGKPDALDLADFLVGTGWRWGEAVALNGHHVEVTEFGTFVTMGRVMRRTHPYTGYVVVEDEGKSDSALRTIKVSPTLATMLKRRKAALDSPDDLIFTTQNGLPWAHENFNKRVWLPALTIAGMAERKPRPTMHWLRHTHAAALIRAGESLPAVSKRLGHVTIGTTVDQYASLVSDVSNEALDRLDGQFYGPGGLRAVDDSQKGA